MQNNSPAYPWPEKNTLKGILKIINVEGITGLCRGLNATIMREMIYSTIRMGAYEPILTVLSHTASSDSNSEEGMASPYVKFGSALLSGGLGAMVANPTDLIKVNFQAVLPGRTLPYTSTIGGFLYIYRENGLAGLYKGGVATTCRAALVTSACIGSYDSIKNNVLKKYFHFQDGMPLFCTCSLLAGVIATTVANPGASFVNDMMSTGWLIFVVLMFLSAWWCALHAVDVVKTRYMSDSCGLYRGPIHCALITLRNGGVSSFFQVCSDSTRLLSM